MGNVHDKFTLSWIKESAWRTRPAALYAAGGTTTYQFGEMSETIDVPSAQATINRIPVYSSWDASVLVQDKAEVMGNFPFTVRNGIELYYAFGKCSTTGESAPYTHAITGLNAGQMPSRDFHVENRGGTDDLIYDVVGVKTAGLNLQAGIGTRARLLEGRLSYVGCKIVCDDADTNPAVQQSTTPPALPVQTNKFPFRLGPSANMVTWDDSDIAELLHWGYTESNTLQPRWTSANTSGPASDGLDEYGKNERRWAQFVHELGERFHVVNLLVVQKSKRFWDALMDAVAKTLVTKFSRDTTNDDDYIKLTCSNSYVQAHPVPHPTAGDEATFAVNIVPTTTTVEVKDDLAKSYYEVT